MADIWPCEVSFSQLCCLKGKIVLPPRTLNSSNSDKGEYENFVHQLWLRDDSFGRVARKYARQLNNCLTLASQVVSEINLADGAFQPNLTIHGRLYHKIGSLLPPVEGLPPVFAQIYLLDGEHERERVLDVRRRIFHVPERMSAQEQTILNDIILSLDRALRECNPFIKDFNAIMALDIPTDDISNLR